MDKAKNEIAKLNDSKIETDLNLTITQGQNIMDTLQKNGITEAKFKNGMYFTSNNNSRAVANKGVMVQETKTDIVVRIPKDGHSFEEIINTEVPKPTQKLLGAYTKKSQSEVSKKTKKKKSEKKK